MDKKKYRNGVFILLIKTFYPKKLLNRSIFKNIFIGGFEFEVEPRLNECHHRFLIEVGHW
jgi:hypothetical protein